MGKLTVVDMNRGDGAKAILGMDWPCLSIGAKEKELAVPAATRRNAEEQNFIIVKLRKCFLRTVLHLCN